MVLELARNHESRAAAFPSRTGKDVRRRRDGVEFYPLGLRRRSDRGSASRKRLPIVFEASLVSRGKGSGAGAGVIAGFVAGRSHCDLRPLCWIG